MTFIRSFDFDGEYLTWATNGFAGYTKIIKGRFSINADRGLLKPKNELLNIYYIKYKIEPIFRGLAKGRKGERGEDEFTKVYPSMIEDIEISVPVNNTGNIDVTAQEDIVEKINLVHEINTKVEEYKRKIDELTISVPIIETYKTFEIERIFDLSVKTNKSNFTKSFIDKHKGNIPVYSASKFPDTVDYGYVQDNLKGIKYFENCLTWNIDGSIGKAHYRSGRFSLSEKVIPLIINEEFKDKIDIEYIKYSIEVEFSKHSFNFGNKAGKGKIKDIRIPIPVDNTGDLSISLQKQFAARHKKVDAIKSLINEELDKLLEVRVELE